MRVMILGVGDAFTAQHFGSSALIEAPDGRVLIDCPDLIHRALRESGGRAGWPVTADDIDDIILTHLHGDHCNGLESFGFWRNIRRTQGDGSVRPSLHTSRPAAERLWERLAPAMDGRGRLDPERTLADFYGLHILEPGQSANIAGLTVDCRFTGHPLTTIGLRLTDGRHTFGWSSDATFEPEHIDWLSAADVIVHECNRGPAHTPIEALNGLPDDPRRRMRLIHLPDDFDATCTDIRVLREGDVIELSAASC